MHINVMKLSVALSFVFFAACKTTTAGSLVKADGSATNPNVVVHQNALLQYENPLAMTKELTPVKVEDASLPYDVPKAGEVVNQRSLEDCWFLASKVAYEYDLATLGHPMPLALDHLYYNLFTDWLPSYVAGTFATGIDTGGDEFLFDDFMMNHGLMPYTAMKQLKTQVWVRIDREVTKQAEKFKAKYDAAADDAAHGAVVEEAKQWLAAYFAKNLLQPVPETFAFAGQQGLSAKDFVAVTGLDKGETHSYVDNAVNAEKYTAALTNGHRYEQKSRAELKQMIRDNINAGKALRTAVNWSWSRINDGSKMVNEDPQSSGIKGIVNSLHYTGTHESVPHEVLIVGYRDEGNDMVAVKIQNSWGHTAGNNGAFYFDMNEFWDFFRDLSVRTYPVQ